MSATSIVEVRQRTPDDLLSRELGFFTDITMARQTIDWCYREAYKVMMQKTFIPDPWLTQAVQDEMLLKGYNVWMVDNLNGGMPLFYTVAHTLYSNVPVVNNNFIFTISDTPAILQP